jgi:hypothetical protein
MHVDALTLAALAAELRRDLLGARIEDAIQPTPRAVALQCWGGGRNSWLLLSAHPQMARVHLLDRKPRKLAAEPPSFVMLLRKHLEGARVAAIDQPHWERVLAIGFARRGPREADPGGADRTGADASGTFDPPQPSVWLIAEMMGRLSNLVLRDDAGTILGALHLVGPEVNRYRTIAPNQPYLPPPPQTRVVGDETLPRPRPETVTAADLAEAAAAMLAAPLNPKRPPRVANLLASHLLGFGPDLGREAAARVLGAPDAALAADLPWDALAHAARKLAALPATGAWHPTLVLAPDVRRIHNEDTEDTEEGRSRWRVRSPSPNLSP